MYFGQFDSFSQAEEAASSFYISTIVQAGAETVEYISSAIPIDQLGAVTQCLEEAAAQRTIWYQWDRKTNRITAIPYDRIVKISFSLTASA